MKQQEQRLETVKGFRVSDFIKIPPGRCSKGIRKQTTWINNKTQKVVEIRGVFGPTFTGTVTPEGLDSLDFKDASSEHLEDLRVAVRAGGGEEKSKLSKPSSTRDRPYHAKQNIHGKDLRNDPQVEQWVA
jgi:hypothetical protein